MNRTKYTTSGDKKESVKTAIVIIVLAIEIALGVWEFTRYREPTGWDVSYPMANANLQWAYTSDGRCQP